MKFLLLTSLAAGATLVQAGLIRGSGGNSRPSNSQAHSERKLKPKADKGKENKDENSQTEKTGTTSDTSCTFAFSTLVNAEATRFHAWANIDSETAMLAGALGYDSSKWDNLMTHDLELLAWDDATASLSGMALAAFQAYYDDEDFYDESINHYEGYSWDDMVTEGLEGYLTTLGYTKSMWDNGDLSGIDTKYWKELSPSQMEAAQALGYTQPIWDDVPLSLWEVPSLFRK